MALKLEIPQKQKDYLYAIGVGGATLLAAVLLSIFVIKPQWQNNNKLAEKIDEQTAVVAKLETNLFNLQNFEKQTKLVDKYYEITTKALPDKINESQLLLLIEGIKNSSSAIVNNADFTPGAGGEKTVDLTFDLISTDYNNLKSFFQTLENSLRVISVDSFSIKESGEGNLSMSIKAKTYHK